MKYTFDIADLLLALIVVVVIAGFIVGGIWFGLLVLAIPTLILGTTIWALNS